MTGSSVETLHATCVAIGNAGVLIEGPSGSGKSDLALRLIDRGAVLVSDDYTELSRVGDRLTARAPATIAGQIEVRGLGIESLPFCAQVDVALVVRSSATPPRMPEEGAAATIAGLSIPMTELTLLEPSAPIKVERALARQLEGGGA